MLKFQIGNCLEIGVIPKNMLLVFNFNTLYSISTYCELGFNFSFLRYKILKKNIMKNNGEIITLAEAIEFTHEYQESFPSGNIAYAVSKDKLLDIIQQVGCEGVRIYNGIDAENGNSNLVLVGIDDDGEDMTQGVILERLNVCPSYCPVNSALIRSYNIV